MHKNKMMVNELAVDVETLAARIGEGRIAELDRQDLIQLLSQYHALLLKLEMVSKIIADALERKDQELV